MEQNEIIHNFLQNSRNDTLVENVRDMYWGQCKNLEY